jgi:hypothetical protein
MSIGDKIRVNKGQVEVLVEMQHPYGLFKSNTYSVVRNMAKIQESEIIGSIHSPATASIK